MSSDVSREELVGRVLRVSRKVGNQSGLFSQAVAERLGLAGIDVECLDVLLTEGRVTVGRLAELTGLTTGSATRMVDRLEQGGFVHRVPDPADRRRVLVEAAPGLGAKMSSLHDSLRQAQMEIIAGYDAGQLELFAGFLERLGRALFEEGVKMRAPREEPDAGGSYAGGSYAAPVGGVTAGKLIFLTGAPRVTVKSDPTLKDLYRASFQGPMPRVRVRGGVVTVAYPHFGWMDWRAQFAGQLIDASMHWQKDNGEILLNPAVPWAIELRGGVSSWTADLRGIRLESFELKGGASQIYLLLPPPIGTVPIRVVGGLNKLTIERPAGTAAGLELRGGVGEVNVDGEIHKGAGRLSLQTAGASSTPDRYEIEISGGASKLSITGR